MGRPRNADDLPGTEKGVQNTSGGNAEKRKAARVRWKDYITKNLSDLNSTLAVTFRA